MEKDNIEETPVIEPIADLDTLHVEMGSYRTIIPDRFKNRKSKIPPKSHIVAQIPGNIREIFVKEGQKIKEGEALLMLEAMKMNNILTSPMVGVVQSIKVETGNVVPKGHLLMTIGPA